MSDRAAAQHRTREQRAPRRRFLVAEDDDAARELLRRYLEGKGSHVTAVADGQAVLDALDRDDYDLVILDVMMPKLSGFEVLAKVRAQANAVPVIMATAAASPDDVVRALEGGADDYVTKPFSFPVLMARIDLRLRLRPPVELDASDSIESEEAVDDLPLPTRTPAPLAPLDDGGILARLRRAADRFATTRKPALELGKGTTIADRYVVVEKIGEGGFGTVFRARHNDLGTDVAVKVLSKSARGAIDGFRREAQNACRVRHPNAVRVFDFGVLPGASAFLVMELLEGPTLEQLIRDGVLPLDRTIAIMRAVFAALAAAHRQNLVHRDVKPQNVVLHSEDGREVPKLLDFGIATMLEDADDSGSAILGSAPYIAPERLKNEPYDGRADVYASGIMLYRMLTGRFPFDLALDDFDNLALWHLHAPAPAASWRNAKLSAGVDKVVQRLLEKDPRKRPDASEAEALVEGLVWE